MFILMVPMLQCSHNSIYVSFMQLQEPYAHLREREGVWGYCAGELQVRGTAHETKEDGRHEVTSKHCRTTGELSWKDKFADMYKNSWPTYLCAARPPPMRQEIKVWSWRSERWVC